LANSSVNKSANGRQTSAKRLSPDVGDPAPDATLTDINGGKVTLSSFWTQKPVILVFLRYFGCPFCREQVANLKAGYSQLSQANVEVVCIGQGPYKAGKAFSIYYDLPFPVLVCEEDNSVYGRYGLTKGTLSQLFGLNVLLRAFSALRHGVGSVSGDPTQMPGTFIIDTSGTVLMAHRAQNQADNITAEQLLSVISRK